MGCLIIIYLWSIKGVQSYTSMHSEAMYIETDMYWNNIADLTGANNEKEPLVGTYPLKSLFDKSLKQNATKYKFSFLEYLLGVLKVT